MENHKKYHFLSNLPDKKNRYIIVDTETTGLNQKKDNILEIAAIEFESGAITGNQFHGYLKARTVINSMAEEKHRINKDFYEIHIKGYFKSDKILMQNFIKFIGDSIIFAHNATFDLAFINRELEFWNLPQISIDRYRCTMRIAKQIFKDDGSELYKKCSLKNCLEYFNIVTDTNSLHNALYDCLMTGKLLNRIYCLIDENKKEEENNFLISKIEGETTLNVNHRDELNKFENEYDEDLESIEKILEEMNINSKNMKEENKMEIKRTDDVGINNNEYKEVNNNNKKSEVYKVLMKNFIKKGDNKK